MPTDLSPLTLEQLGALLALDYSEPASRTGVDLCLAELRHRDEATRELILQCQANMRYLGPVAQHQLRAALSAFKEQT